MLIAGVDEVGRGPLAGPVVAAAVVYKNGYINEKIRDSKQLSAKKREQLIDVIKNDAHDWAIVAVGPRHIEELNIRQAAKLAMSIAVKNVCAELVLVDGNMPIDTEIEQQTVVKGDSKHVEISAASILAKVWRDTEMKRLDEEFPGYELSSHAGYPTKKHREAIARLGPSPIHRHTFKGVKEHLEKMYSSNTSIPSSCCEEQILLYCARNQQPT